MFDSVGILHFNILSALVLCIGITGILINRKSIILILLSIELILLAVTINLVAFSAHWQNLTGQVFALFVITVAAAESAIGLALLIVYFRKVQNIEITKMNKLHG